MDRSARWLLWCLLLWAGICLGVVLEMPLVWAPAGQGAIMTAVYCLGRDLERRPRDTGAPIRLPGRRRITEYEFRLQLAATLADLPKRPAAVTGPGRSGAIASVYASHLLSIPWVPYGQAVPLRPLLVVDTAEQTGATLRRAIRKTGADLALAVYREPPRLRFWYER